MMCFSSCRTIKEIKVEYCVPDVDWPEFPQFPEYEIRKDGVLVKDENYFRQLLIFRESYKSERDKYNEKKMKLEEEQNELR